MVMEYLPTGAHGLMMSVVLAALMNSFTSIFNSSSTLFTIDLWQRLRSKATERELMIVGRVFIVVLVALSVLWIPVFQTQEGGQLFTYIQKVGSYFQPPIAACFILAMFWKRTSERGAFWGLVSGITIGLLRMILDFIYPVPPCGQDDLRPSIVKDVHYLHFTVILTVITTVIIAVLSLLSPPISDAEVGGLTWWTRFDPLRIVSKKTEKSALVADDEVAKQYDNIISPDTGQNQQQDVGEFDLGHPSTRFELLVESVSYHGKDEVV